MLKSKDTLDKVNEVFPNILMQLTNSSNNNNKINNNKGNPLMISVGENILLLVQIMKTKFKIRKKWKKIGN